MFSVMKHNTYHSQCIQEKASAQVKIQEFDVLLVDSKVIFSWNSKDISEIAHDLGEVDIDQEPCW